MLIKQAIDVSFAQGLDTKTDPKRVPIGKFVALENTVFQKGGLLQKRNGYGPLPTLPDTSYTYLTTLSGGLTAIGKNIAALNTAGASWVTKGSIQPMSVSTLPIIRNNFNQTSCDSVVAPNGLVLTAYLESDGTTVTNKYVIADSVTGQNIVEPSVIPVGSGVVSGGMRVFFLGTRFIIMFTNTIGGAAHLQYVAISAADPTIVGPNTDIAASYQSASTLSWDGFVVNDSLYIAYSTAAGGQKISVTFLTKTLVQVFTQSALGFKATVMSVTADVTNPTSPVIWISFYDAGTTNGYSWAVNQSLATLLAPQDNTTTGFGVPNLASAAQNGKLYLFIEVTNAYSFDGTVPTNYVVREERTLSGFFAFNCVRSVGLASKAFIVDGVVYFLAAYQSQYQPTYFLINGTKSLQASPVVAAKLAYQNGGGYLLTGLPSVNVSGSSAKVAYLFKDLIQAVNKNTNVPAGNQVAGIYSQTGINLGTFKIGSEALDTAEIGGDLHLSGGFLWMYDGYLPVEHNFLLWPDTDQTNPTDTAAWSATGGSMAAKPDGSTNTNAYYYQITYEWTDNQGNAFRSAPSIPTAVTTTGSGSAGSVVLNIPTLRLTYKTANPVKIVIYRWSVAQQEYYQVTSITSPLLNNTSVDSVTFTDTLADATILGNNLLYTTGGVVEDVNAPASNILTLFDTRLWLVDAEDPNVLWYSKQVIQATPVEMSDLFTVYVPPTTSTQGSTGPVTALSVMDDKLIIGKRNAFLYINGTGPDNTGAGSQYSQPIFITATVGCTNQKSFVLIPDGLMFQSDKGIWLLNRNLQTSYIGAAVESFTTGATVVSAVNVPETNQVRFVLDSGITLMYDYFYGQWGTFVNVPAVSSCIFEQMHTYINDLGATYQETDGLYLDNDKPVLISFTTGPLNLGTLQGYQRAYFFYLLGDYISPHQLMVRVSYDYSSAPSHGFLITPTNFSTAYGSGPSQSPYGQGNPYGGPGVAENWRVFLQQQRCMAFSISVQEIFDPTLGVAAGAGLTLSGINVVLALKSKFRPNAATQSVG